MTYIIVVAILLIIGLWVVSTYNSLITLGERVENAKAQIGTQLESRWDSI